MDGLGWQGNQGHEAGQGPRGDGDDRKRASPAAPRGYGKKEELFSAARRGETMTDQKIGTREEWLAARLELLKAEKELTLRSGGRSCRGFESIRSTVSRPMMAQRP